MLMNVCHARLLLKASIKLLQKAVLKQWIYTHCLKATHAICDVSAKSSAKLVVPAYEIITVYPNLEPFTSALGIKPTLNLGITLG